MTLQHKIRPWVPPVIWQTISRLRHGPSGLVGLYPDKGSASAQATGYDSQSIIDRVAAATEAVMKSDGHTFDRDSVVFDHPITPFPLLACLLRIAHSSEVLRVIDFGGALGSTYRQCRPFLSHLKAVHWNVVEQSHFADCGSASFSTECLHFFKTIPEATFEHSPHAVIFSSVLQYLDDPYSILEQAVAVRPLAIIIDRTPHSGRVDDMFSLEVVPRSIYPAQLACRIFGAQTIESALSPNYKRFSNFDSIDPDMMVESLQVSWRGMYFERDASMAMPHKSENLAVRSR